MNYKVGDIVLITGKNKGYPWLREMSRYIGSIGVIEALNAGYVDIQVTGSYCCYPYGSFEKVSSTGIFIKKYSLKKY
jgi:hypothetical protein